jgi:predicted amidohydrolase
MREPHGPVPTVEGFRVVERTYSADDSHLSFGLANIQAEVPGIEENKRKIERAVRVFRKLGVNVAIFPEFALSGYFWDDERECRGYMDRAVIERHVDWINQILLPLCTGELNAIVLNNVATGENGGYRNRTIIVSPSVDDPLAPGHCYDKIFLPGIENTYTESGSHDRLVLDSPRGHGRFGFATCYDYLFTELLRNYSFGDGVDAIIEIASWRAAASREYHYLNVRTDLYYGHLWDTVLAASSAQNQIWTIACNAVGRHGITGTSFWGGSGIWAPSGIKLLQASNILEELLVIHNLDIKGAREFERADFDYEFDFRQVYERMDDGDVAKEHL